MKAFAIYLYENVDWVKIAVRDRFFLYDFQSGEVFRFEDQSLHASKRV